MDIKFKQTGGPYGDATSNYDVIVPGGTTVREFIRYIRDEYSVKHGEWGTFAYNHPFDKFLSYNRGSLFFEEDPYGTPKEKCQPILDEIIDKKIIKIKANGGWSAMSYTLYLEEATE
jgi:hypothetical protein